MADALLSPAVGTVMWGATTGTIAYCSTMVNKELDDRKVPLMGALGAFLFAAQMINFTIPATGSSGHLGGGLLLTILLGPHAAFLTLASVLVVQALFFADGGLLALGCNIFNLGFFPAFVAYPLIYRPITGSSPSKIRTIIASIAAAVVGLQLGAFSVVIETVFSGISALPYRTFVSLLQPIHLGIGLVEGIVTAVIVGFVRRARPDIFTDKTRLKHGFLTNLVPAFLMLALATGGFISWFASEKPDGLEWAIKKITGNGEIESLKGGLHENLARLQARLAFLPDYNFNKPEEKRLELVKTESAGKNEVVSRQGTSIAGIAGALLTLCLAATAGFILRKRQQLAATRPHCHEHAHPHCHEHEHPHNHGDIIHSHGHSHEHSHPHPHMHDHAAPHQTDPNPQHGHVAKMADHNHRHDDHDHGSHEHSH